MRSTIVLGVILLLASCRTPPSANTIDIDSMTLEELRPSVDMTGITYEDMQRFRERRRAERELGRWPCH